MKPTKISVWEHVRGCEPHCVYEKAYGPLNLKRAVNNLFEYQKENVRNFGNIGCGHVFLRLDDVEMYTSDFGAFGMYLEEGGMWHAAEYVEEAFRWTKLAGPDVELAVAS